MNFIYGTLLEENGGLSMQFASEKVTVDRSVLGTRPGLAAYAGKETVIGCGPGTSRWPRRLMAPIRRRLSR